MTTLIHAWKKKADRYIVFAYQSAETNLIFMDEISRDMLHILLFIKCIVTRESQLIIKLLISGTLNRSLADIRTVEIMRVGNYNNFPQGRSVTLTVS